MSQQVLRGYQQDMLDAITIYLEEHEGNPICVSPTGTGKSLVCNALIKWVVTEFPGRRVMCITHDAKIIQQNCNSMVSYWQRAPVGIFSAGLEQRNTTASIIYCGVQSVYRSPEAFGFVDLIIIDECHMVGPREDTMYGKVLHALKRVNPEIRVVGFSASPYRMGQGLLTEGVLFDDICVDFSTTEKFNWFIDEGYLSPLYTKRTASEIDLSNVSTQMGEFNLREMEVASDTEALNICVVKECLRYGERRNHWMVFTSGVKHAEHLNLTFQSYGVSSLVVHGKMPMKERDQLEEDFCSGKTRACNNVGIFNVGWDFPPLDLIVVAKGTQSVSWWVQALGRGTRPVYAMGFDLDTREGRLAAIAAGPKPNGCLVLDFGSNTPRLGPINNPCVPKPRKKGDKTPGEAPVKECQFCHTYNHTRATHCIECGEEFPPASCLEAASNDHEVMVRIAQTPQHEVFDIMQTIFREHVARDGGSCIRVSYCSMLETFSEYFKLNSGMIFLDNKLRDFWLQSSGSKPVPFSVEEFLSRTGELKQPKRVEIVTNSKFKDVKRRFYD